MIEAKKILIISHNSFSSSSNNGKTLESMFNWVDKNNLAQLFFSENEDPDFEFCSNYYKITDLDVLKSLANKSTDKNLSSNSGKQGGESETSRKGNNYIFESLKALFKKQKFFRDKLWEFGNWKTDGLMNWLKSFSPDVIFYLGGDYKFSHKIATDLANTFNIPLIVYFTDDYIIHPKVKGVLNKINQSNLIKTYKETISQASVCFAIGEKMANSYSDFFKKAFYPIMNSVQILPLNHVESQGEIQISYFGGLHLNRDKALIRFGQLLNGAILNIYSNSKVSNDLLDEFKKNGIYFKGPVFGADLKNAIINSDFLLHVESNNPDIKSITKLSISTKIPEYLSYGKTVIGFGPKDVASMEILIDNQIGYFIDMDDIDEKIRISLGEFIKNEELSEIISQNGYNFAKENFDNYNITSKFKKILNKNLYGDTK